MNQTVLQYLPAAIVRMPAQCGDRGLHLLVTPDSAVPPPHRCYLPPGHKDRWHRCGCGCAWTADGSAGTDVPADILIFTSRLSEADEHDLRTQFLAKRPTRRHMVLPSSPSAVWPREDVDEPDVPRAPLAKPEHPWLRWIGCGLAAAALVAVVIGATGPW